MSQSDLICFRFYFFFAYRCQSPPPPHPKICSTSISIFSALDAPPGRGQRWEGHTAAFPVVWREMQLELSAWEHEGGGGKGNIVHAQMEYPSIPRTHIHSQVTYEQAKTIHETPQLSHASNFSREDVKGDLEYFPIEEKHFNITDRILFQKVRPRIATAFLFLNTSRDVKWEIRF